MSGLFVIPVDQTECGVLVWVFLFPFPGRIQLKEKNGTGKSLETGLNKKLILLKDLNVRSEYIILTSYNFNLLLNDIANLLGGKPAKQAAANSASNCFVPNLCYFY